MVAWPAALREGPSCEAGTACKRLCHKFRGGRAECGHKPAGSPWRRARRCGAPAGAPPLRPAPLPAGCLAILLPAVPLVCTELNNSNICNAPMPLLCRSIQAPVRLAVTTALTTWRGLAGLASLLPLRRRRQRQRQRPLQAIGGSDGSSGLTEQRLDVAEA